MATLNEILYEVKEGNSSFNITDDYRIDDMLLISIINEVRATLIREEKARNGYIADKYYQMNCCYEIVCEDESCTYNGIKIHMNHPVHKVKLKPHITGIGGKEISFIGNPYSNLSFNNVGFDAYMASEGRQWTKFDPIATVLGAELLLKNLPTEGLKFICIKELLDNPTDACGWNNDESEYPVPSRGKLVDMVLYKLMTRGRLPDDKLNNAADDTVPTRTSDEMIGAMQGLVTEPKQQQQQ